MSLRFFSDQCVPTEITECLKQLVRFLSANPIQTFYRGKLFIVEPHRIRIRQ